MKSIRVSAAVIHDGRRFFATRRGYGPWKDWWEFPGGKREEGESGEEALLREIREELDAEIEIESFLCLSSWDYPEFHLDMDCYLCHLRGGHLVLKEHEDARWVTPEESEELKWLPADTAVLDKLRHVLGEKVEE